MLPYPQVLCMGIPTDIHSGYYCGTTTWLLCSPFLTLVCLVNLRYLNPISNLRVWCIHGDDTWVLYFGIAIAQE